jgi:diacylglycerol kinase family enzyme
MHYIPTENYAVILNKNAGRVNDQLVQKLVPFVPKGQLYLSESQLHARDIVHKMIHENVDTIFAGGGDGTIVDTINNVYEMREKVDRLPAVGALKLGTGNALSYWLKNPNPDIALQKFQRGETHRKLQLRFVEAEDTLFPFAGLGVDAAILNDYNEFKNNGKGRWYESLAKGIAGYLIAGHAKTVPDFLRRPKTHVKIINIGETAYKIGPHGEERIPVKTNEVLYEGMASMVGCANTPFYGYGFKMFPFASQLTERFQIRVIDMSAFQMVNNLYAAWSGELRHPNIHDFYADRVRVICEDAMPYQLGGEAAGYRKEVTFSVSEQPVDLIGRI